MSRHFFVLFLILGLAYSCTTDDKNINVDSHFSGYSTSVVYLDTFTVEIATYKMDSILTSESDRLLIGQYEDDYFGKVRAEAYFDLLASSYSVSEGATLDSVALVLGYDNYFLNDTLSTSTYHIFKLTDEMSTPYDGFYNTSSISHEDTEVLTLTFKPTPRSKDSLHISLPNSFGLPIFNAIENGQFNEYSDILPLFKGFVIKPGDNDNSAIIGFSKERDHSYLRFYYSDDDLDYESETFDLRLNLNGNTSFSNLSSTNQITCLQDLENQEHEVPSSECYDNSYVQCGTGYLTKISFPSINNLYDITDKGTVLNAELILKPKPNSYSDILTLRDSLVVSIVDVNNDITSYLSTNSSSAYAILDKESIEFNDISYRIPVEEYVKSKINSVYDTEDALAIFPSDYNASVDRVILSNSENLTATLGITYVIYDYTNEED